MTTITDAHRAEARRRLETASAYPYPTEEDLLAQALAEPAWTPPVDPVQTIMSMVRNMDDDGKIEAAIRDAIKRRQA